ncbi:MAG: hypothetical protein H7101_12955 [Deinococcales bacterium]|nr:hypothetical protein [Chitinophagaceae bacterium]
MTLKLSTTTKLFLVIIAFVVAVIGFMLKLPFAFRHYDKELHAAFYFLAAGFLNILFANRNTLIHASIFIVLFVFGVCIEYAQEYSNKLLHKKIHGRFDIEDVQSNLKGLLAFSMLWLVYIVMAFLYQQVSSKKTSGS